MKIAVNMCYGGFHLSDEAVEYLGGKDTVWAFDIERTNETTIKMIEELGTKRVSHAYSRIGIAEIPDDATDWKITEYDGIEHVIYVLDGKLNEAYGEVV